MKVSIFALPGVFLVITMLDGSAVSDFVPQAEIAAYLLSLGNATRDFGEHYQVQEPDLAEIFGWTGDC